MEGVLRQILIWICVPIYKTIPKLYSIFYFLSNARFLEKGVVDQLSKNLYVLVSVVMLFAFSATLLSAIVNPDVMETGKNKVWAVFKRSVIGIVLIVAVPFLFDLAYEVQNGIMKNATIEKLILGINTSSNTKYGDKSVPAKGGQLIAGKLISSVLYPVDNPIQVPNPQVGPEYKKMVTTDINSINFIAQHILIAPSNTTNSETYAFEFDGFIAVIAGFAVDYILVLYCLDMAVRMFVLAFLEITAPIAILAYIALGNKYILNWAKQVGTTFADVFMRVAAMGFYLFFVSRINTFLNTPALWGISETDTVNSISGFGWRLLLQVIIIVGLLTFVRRLPNYINKAFGTNLGNGPKGLAGRLQPVTDSINDLNRARQGLGRVVGSTAAVASNIASRAIGGFQRGWRQSGDAGNSNTRRFFDALGSSLTGASLGALTSVGAARRGWQTGNLTAIGNEVARDRNTHPEGSTAPGRIADILTQTIGMGTALDRANERIARDNRILYNGQHYTLDQINGLRDQYNDIQTRTQNIQNSVNTELDRADSEIVHDYTFTDIRTGQTYDYRGQNFHQMAETIQALRESGPRISDYMDRNTGMIDYQRFHDDSAEHNRRIARLENEIEQQRIFESTNLINEAAAGVSWATHNRARDASNGQAANTTINTITDILQRNPEYAQNITTRAITDFASLEAMNTQATHENNTIQRGVDTRNARMNTEYQTDQYRRAERNNQSSDARNAQSNTIHTTDRNAHNNY